MNKMPSIECFWVKKYAKGGGGGKLLSIAFDP